MNALLGNDTMKTGEIREYDSQGRHTTTHRQCFMLPDEITLGDGAKITAGARIIDTPGMRMLQVSYVEEGLSNTFADIEEWSMQCKFRNCTHGNEPGCAIRAAIENGNLSVKTWKNYLSMQKEEEFAKQRAKIRARRQERRKGKHIG